MIAIPTPTIEEEAAISCEIALSWVGDVKGFWVRLALAELVLMAVLESRRVKV